MSGIRIERAGLQEVVEAAVLGRRFHREAGAPGKFDGRTFAKTWKALLQSPDATMLVAKQGKDVTGGVGGVVFPCPFTGDRISQEFFWFVDQERRGGRTAYMLLKAFEDWSREREAKRIHMVALGKLNSAKLGRFYERRGYEFMETVYWKGL